MPKSVRITTGYQRQENGLYRGVLQLNLSNDCEDCGDRHNTKMIRYSLVEYRTPEEAVRASDEIADYGEHIAMALGYELTEGFDVSTN